MRHSQRRDQQASYLAMVFRRDSPFPLPHHAGTPIKDLPLSVLDYYLSGGMKHQQLYSVLRQERQQRIAELPR